MNTHERDAEIRGIACDCCGTVVKVPRGCVPPDDWSDRFVTRFDEVATVVLREHERVCAA